MNWNFAKMLWAIAYNFIKSKVLINLNHLFSTGILKLSQLTRTVLDLTSFQTITFVQESTVIRRISLRIDIFRALVSCRVVNKHGPLDNPIKRNLKVWDQVNVVAIQCLNVRIWNVLQTFQTAIKVKFLKCVGWRHPAETIRCSFFFISSP